MLSGLHDAWIDRIDLPLKALVWQDAAGRVRLGYNDLAWLVTRHGAGDCPGVGTLSKGMEFARGDSRRALT
ncbi:MAG: hypothetical protein ABI277_16235 [Burkholderiaceae bacterium]